MKMVWQNRDILKQSFFEVHGEKNTVQKRKRKHAKKSEDRPTALGKKKLRVVGD